MENINQILVKTRDLAKTVPSLYNPDMAKKREKFEDKFYDVLESFKKEVEKATDADLKRALYFGFKDFKDFLLDEYTNAVKNLKINGKEPDMDSVIAEVLMFDNLVFNEFNEFRKKIESQIEIKSSNYNGEYNRFKKCPHCGIIWFKIIGCNSIICGNRTKIEDKIIGKYKKYTVTFVNNKVVINFEDSEKDLNDLKNLKRKRRLPDDEEFYGLTDREEDENEEREKKGKILIKPIGCGKESSWKEMEDCSEEVIKKLKEISVDDYYSKLLDISDSLNKK